MFTVQVNSRTTLEYEHVPINHSANVVTGIKYFTKIYLPTGDGKRYFLGEADEKLDEEQVKARFEEIMYAKRERQYGTQRPLLRKDLSPISARGRVNRGIDGSILNRQI